MARLAAGIRKRPDGTLEKRFTVSGKRYSVYGSTQKEVKQKELEARQRIAAGEYNPNSKITLDEYFKSWIKERALSVKPNTVRLYDCEYTKRISPALGKCHIQKIERRQVVEWHNSLLDCLTASSANHILGTLKSILNGAVQEEIIKINPAANVRPARDDRKRATETYHRALTREEQHTFIAAAQNDYYGNLLEFLLYSGCRVGEAAALQWNDIDHKNGVIHIRRTVTYTADRKMTTGTPKTRAGMRDIPLTNNLLGVLKRQRAADRIISLDNPLLFTTPYCGIISDTQANIAIQRILNTLDKQGTHIEHFTAHALRDTFATRYIENGGTPQVLKTILGHESYSMTMDLYSHVMKDTAKKEMQSINIAL